MCAGSVRISLAGRIIYFLCGTPFWECRAGTIYLSVGRKWAAGLYIFSSCIICQPCVYKLLISFSSLQVVEEEFGPGGL